MEELHTWLSTQHNGLKTHTAFQSKALQLAAEHPQNAALLHLLATLADNFSSFYDESPLSGDVADRAFNKLKQLVQKSADWESMSDADKIALLNEIARTELG